MDPWTGLLLFLGIWLILSEIIPYLDFKSPDSTPTSGEGA